MATTEKEVTDKIDELEEVVVEEVEEVVEAPQPTESELAALNKGWKPKDEWEGEDSDFVSAAEFNRRGELLGKIVNQNRKLQQLEDAVENMKGHHEKVREREYERALSSLKSRKKEALDNEEHDTVIEVDEAINDLRQSQETDNQAQNQPATSATFNSWAGDNSWYNSDQELTPIADGMARSFVSRNQNVSEQEVLDHVSKEIKARYPERFGIPPVRRPKAAAVEGGRASPSRRGSAKFTVKNLDSSQKEIMRNLVRAGALTEEQYIKDLVDIGELS